MDPSGSSSKIPYPEQGPYASSSKVDPYVQSDDVPSNNPPSPPPPHLENWDESAYLYNDRKDNPDGKVGGGPPVTIRQPTEMLQTLADYDHQPVDIPEPTQDDGYGEEEED